MKLDFRKRAGLGRHIKSITTANPDLLLGRHVRDLHGGKTHKISFVILDRIQPNARGEDWNKLLLQRESRWIMELCATNVPGLNCVLNYRPFLEGFSSGVCDKDM